jgi:sigma-B regulation protein RsbU (phosphoserine phosphatase)
LLTVGFVAVLLDGKFMRLGSVLIVVNLLYALPWRYRFAVNATSVLLSAAYVLRNGAGESLLPMVAFGEMLALICLCAIGGAVIHRDRVQFYLAQYRESLYLARLREEISVAAQLQQAMLPAPWPATREFAVHGLMRPAQDIGGDFYDHFAVQSGALCLVVADVCGKGIPAGLFSMSAKSAMRATTVQSSAATAAPDPGALVAGVNNLLHEGNENLLFVTAIYALYQPASGQFDFVNAGHVKPLLLNRDGHARWLDAPKGCALGARAGRTYSAAHIDLQAGDTVLLITDGITEALNSDFEEFGMDRVIQALDGAAGSDAKSCIDRLLSAVDEFTGSVEQSDDITCIAVCHQPAAMQAPQAATTA